jgi:hypothetical protein
MKEIKSVGAQGDVFFVKIDAVEIPNDAKLLCPKSDHHIVAHSETGHHHVVRADGTVFYEGPSDPFTCYLRIDGAFAEVVHQRPFDTHEPVRLGQGVWMVRRQREYTPDGFRRVED